MGFLWLIRILGLYVMYSWNYCQRIHPCHEVQVNRSACHYTTPTCNNEPGTRTSLCESKYKQRIIWKVRYTMLGRRIMKTCYFFIWVNFLESAIWHKKSLLAQYWVTLLYKIWMPNRSWRDLHIENIKSYSPPPPPPLPFWYETWLTPPPLYFLQLFPLKRFWPSQHLTRNHVLRSTH